MPMTVDMMPGGGVAPPATAPPGTAPAIAGDASGTAGGPFADVMAAATSGPSVPTPAPTSGSATATATTIVDLAALLASLVGGTPATAQTATTKSAPVLPRPARHAEAETTTSTLMALMLGVTVQPPPPLVAPGTSALLVPAGNSAGNGASLGVVGAGATGVNVPTGGADAPLPSAVPALPAAVAAASALPAPGSAAPVVAAVYAAPVVFRRPLGPTSAPLPAAVPASAAGSDTGPAPQPSALAAPSGATVLATTPDVVPTVAASTAAATASGPSAAHLDRTGGPPAVAAPVVSGASATSTAATAAAAAAIASTHAGTPATGPAPAVVASGPALVGALADTVQQATLRGDREVRLALNPPDLGQLTVQITAHPSGTVTIAIHATTPAAHDLLQQQLPALRAGLEQRDVHVEQLHVDHQTAASGLGTSDSGGRQPGDQQAWSDQQPQWSPVAAMRNSNSGRRTTAPAAGPARVAHDGQLDLQA